MRWGSCFDNFTELGSQPFKIRYSRLTANLIVYLRFYQHLTFYLAYCLLSGRFSGSLSYILSDIFSGIVYCILSQTLSVSFRHCLWHSIWYSYLTYLLAVKKENIWPDMCCVWDSYNPSDSWIWHPILGPEHHRELATSLGWNPAPEKAQGCYILRIWLNIAPITH